MSIIFPRSVVVRKIGMEVTEIKRGSMESKCHSDKDWKHLYVIVHGGAIASLANSAVAILLS
jgi:acyl-coenzyme A thioesterase PaaI-like protein